ncbi:fimbrial assembly protein [Shewanella livingstonensis]|uniref:Fimbrial assembly protein n=1 Tax=Shewanella livingstonensis TaxID=150120 RepID=A0A3G8LQM5_9GAMM|nr:fimbrial assembly protein [Shewanella livingstonensis]AZG71829.1 fimbrial assembly protein [Shewanella livingstonensis]
MIKTGVNLYSLDLLPKKQRLTFLRMMLALAFFTVCSALLYAAGFWHANELQTLSQQASSDKNRLNNQKVQLEQSIAERKPNADLVAKVELEQQRLDLKKMLKDELSQRNTLISQGYSPMLTDLAAVADSSVWLSHITIEQQNSDIQRIEFEGYGRNPQSIPLWIDKLKTTSTLKGYAFSAMTMDRGEAQPLAFKLISQPVAKEPAQ